MPRLAYDAKAELLFRIYGRIRLKVCRIARLAHRFGQGQVKTLFEPATDAIDQMEQRSRSRFRTAAAPRRSKVEACRRPATATRPRAKVTVKTTGKRTRLAGAQRTARYRHQLTIDLAVGEHRGSPIAQGQRSPGLRPGERNYPVLWRPGRRAGGTGRYLAVSGDGCWWGVGGHNGTVGVARHLRPTQNFHYPLAAVHPYPIAGLQRFARILRRLNKIREVDGKRELHGKKRAPSMLSNRASQLCHFRDAASTPV